MINWFIAGHEISDEHLETAFTALARQGIQLCIDDGFSEESVIIVRNLIFINITLTL